ncbi:hypothetical protein AB0K74_31025 [Streptomyces sp. NPDC056159]|uniref:hypothetical protein n=1 Tax=Streptomyces sp. NPDC056159 TaxID=3155537 RepID=UPI003420B1D9
MAGEEPHPHFHFTPAGSSWLGQIEIWFGILARQPIRRGTFASVNVVFLSSPSVDACGVISCWHSEK